ncbi:hypothetical protein [Anatilimnocola floriformis]|uniref:hypothetical protein n=1 Tax=Anatilimnocola floriformis TaxID=2948575 RepID=UPI0020C3A367|nr:hypothetical protein [Anatilimnocola floriformis]
MSDPTRKTGSSDWSLILPGLLVGVTYGVWALIWPPYHAQLKEAQTKLQVARAGQVSDALLEQKQQEKLQLQKQIADLRKAINTSREKAEFLSGKEENRIGKISLLQDVRDRFEEHGLVVTVDKPRESQQVDLTETFRRAQSRFLTTIAETARATKPPEPVVINPQMFPDGIPPELRAGGTIAAAPVAPVVAPPVELRELEVWGSYNDMQAALAKISQECGESMIVTVSFERHVTGKDRVHLQWQVLCNLRPAVDAPEKFDPNNLAANAP